jgi:putative transposase
VRTIKEFCLEQMILSEEQSLRTAILSFVDHYHTERNHQGLANRLISPEGAILETPAWSSAVRAWAVC